MNSEDVTQATLLLRRMAKGDARAAGDLLPIIYDELHRIADRLMHGQASNHVLQPTALINEAYLKLVNVQDSDWEGRTHFMRIAARAMRTVLIDHARAESSKKRGGKASPGTLYDDQAVTSSDVLQVMAVHEGIEALTAFEPRLAEIVELRFFGGFKNKEIAQLLEIPLRTIEREWQFARSWLKEFFEQNSGDDK